MKDCADCRDGEHPNYDNEVRLTVIRDPQSRKLVKRSYMCEEHREMYASDGYYVGIQDQDDLGGDL